MNNHPPSPATLLLELPDPSATEALGRWLGEHAQAGDIITLAGDLGAGKTTLTQAIGKGLLVAEEYYITSPTFAIIHEYPGRIPLYHLDLYRLADESEAEELGIEEYLYGEGLCVIEWPDRLGGLMPESRLHIELILLSPTARRATLHAIGPGWEERLAGMKAAFAAESEFRSQDSE
ncbi:MAG: tRNA (adenosine(37)-N6)-threonylcarbamoyltransferase complex ATPase subunit type 1 TsaE [Thermodesulfobacteriota bacterium]